MPLGAVSLYTDASTGPVAGRGGFAVTSEAEVLIRGSETGFTTVTRLEGLAVVAALHLAHTQFSGREVIIHTDASLWSLRYSQISLLSQNGWRKPNGKMVKEVDILSSMWDFYDLPRVQVAWVRSHVGIVGNVFADRAAREVKDALIASGVTGAGHYTGRLSA